MLFLSAVLTMGVCFSSSASTSTEFPGKPGKQPINTAIETVKSNNVTEKAFPKGAGVYTVNVYPADSWLNVYYTDYYTTFTGSGNQWLNGTLGTNTANIYEKYGCDSFYIEATVATGTARNWIAYDDLTKIGSGACTSAPNVTLTTFTMPISCKTNQYDVSLGHWVIRLYDNTTTDGADLWGYIYLN